MSASAPSLESARQIWDIVLGALAKRVGPQSLDTWFRPVVPLGFHSGTLHLQAPNACFRSGLLENYAPLLEETVRAVAGQSCRIEVPAGDPSGQGSDSLPTLPVVPAHCLAAPTQENQSWLIEKLWTSQAVGILAAGPKLGKTWLALDMAVSVASATPCLGAFRVHTRGPVLVYAAEDSPAALRIRLESLARTRDLRFENLDVRVITAACLRLDRADDQDRLQATVALHRPVLLVLDPLIRLHALDENASGAVAGLLGYFRTLQRNTGVAIVLVHHVRKNVSSTHAGYSLRGSGDFYAFVDSLLYLQRRRERLTLSAEHRSAPRLDPLTLELVEDPHLHLRLVPEQEESSPPQDSLLDRIPDLLSTSPQPLTAEALRARLQVRNQRILQALRNLCANRRVVRSAQGYTVARNHAHTVQTGG